MGSVPAAAHAFFATGRRCNRYFRQQPQGRQQDRKLFSLIFQPFKPVSPQQKHGIPVFVFSDDPLLAEKAQTKYFAPFFHGYFTSYMNKDPVGQDPFLDLKSKIGKSGFFIWSRIAPGDQDHCITQAKFNKTIPPISNEIPNHAFERKRCPKRIQPPNDVPRTPKPPHKA